ncbi:hypothetical protein DFQ27_002957 [Actinomortierella ambigua]|uniref:Cytochrome P450 n=1 Tax=Actinomortierella ambigua TaxID=1343610 RepID=A0A9P6Q765_9FUNG|nr:hypothetical protein DFQ27_002957 [Actinomortierella ambigua]
MAHAMVLVGLRSVILRHLRKMTRSRSLHEYMTLSSLVLLIGAIIKYPNRAILTRARPDLRDKSVVGLPLLGSLHVVVLNLEWILKTNFENYVKGPTIRWALGDLLGDGIFVSDGAQWRFHRKVTSNMFTTKIYRSLIEGPFMRTGMDLVRAIEYSRHAGETNVDLQDLFLRLTLDTFGMLMFGLDIQSLANEGQNEFADAFDYLSEMANNRIFNPAFVVTELLPWTLFRKRRAKAIVDKYAAMAVEDHRRESPEQKSQRHSDLLDHFMRYKTEEGKGLTDKELRDVFVNFMLAGRDGIAQALTWQFYQLMINPRVSQKLVDEIDTVLDGSKVPMTYEILLQGMPYLKAVTHETLRLHPPLNKNVKMAVQDDVLPCGTKVCAGDFIGFSPWIMGRSRAVWGDDAEVFRPERWIDDHGKFKTQNPFKFNTFSGGPRVCTGQTFATMQVLQTTCLLLQRYTFKMTPNHPPVAYKANISLPMRHPLQTIITPRHGVSPLVAHKK